VLSRRVVSTPCVAVSTSQCKSPSRNSRWPVVVIVLSSSLRVSMSIVLGFGCLYTTDINNLRFAETMMVSTSRILSYDLSAMRKANMVVFIQPGF